MPVFFSALLQAPAGQGRDECQGHGLTQRELQIALWPRVRGCGLFQSLVAAHRWVKADVLLKSRKVHPHAALAISGHAVADGFQGLQRGKSQRPDLPHTDCTEGSKPAMYASTLAGLGRGGLGMGTGQVEVRVGIGVGIGVGVKLQRASKAPASSYQNISAAS